MASPIVPTASMSAIVAHATLQRSSATVSGGGDGGKRSHSPCSMCFRLSRLPRRPRRAQLHLVQKRRLLVQSRSKMRLVNAALRRQPAMQRRAGRKRLHVRRVRPASVSHLLLRARQTLLPQGRSLQSALSLPTSERCRQNVLCDAPQSVFIFLTLRNH